MEEMSKSPDTSKHQESKFIKTCGFSVVPSFACNIKLKKSFKVFLNQALTKKGHQQSNEERVITIDSVRVYSGSNIRFSYTKSRHRQVRYRRT